MSTLNTVSFDPNISKMKFKEFCNVHGCSYCLYAEQKRQCFLENICRGEEEERKRELERKLVYPCPRMPTEDCPYSNASGTCFGFCLVEILKQYQRMKKRASERRTRNVGEVEIIEIDHGWSMTKTRNHVFVSGVKEELVEPALKSHLLEYENRFYSIGEKRMAVRANKTENQNYFLLTLAAIAKELKSRGKNEADIIIAAGLPIARYGEEKAGFQQYLKQKEDLSFFYENEPYHVKIKGVAVYPQCYAAVFDQLSGADKVLCVDIGSWTIDIVPISRGEPILGEVKSIPRGLITCIHNINTECYKQIGEQVDEDVIQRFMINGKDKMLDESIAGVIKSEIAKYMDGIYQELREHQVNLRTTPLLFCGGGAIGMKHFGNLQGRNIRYITDVKANAMGYGKLATMSMSRNG